ncbi:3'-5' exonuclease [Paenibacillus alvei]|uniref:3'-5' exonuclease n=2 Tax=Paenibacillus alvei TaxID=44250 RepID=A0ABT4H0X1_PAEAL|nr:3'-5' exonuclease [Paenibacillus alvei]MCY9733586.1 3'-5' exonuclease [Paenibacillus alvei]MCY9752690.1 3'-5' exonuclease [Paenibacillus alvei]MCY9762604.1 3'-5' exonuclease [Paenibacillus alvei]MCY9769189.1 3'-5' exonuclease [Paenibacillus alvei]
MEITLAVEVFQLENRFSTAMYCDIKGIKEGYMFLNQGKSTPDKVFGEGIICTLRILEKKYNDRSLLLAFPEVYLSITNPQTRTEIYRLLNQFISFKFIKDEYEELLKVVNHMGHTDLIKEGTLHGYLPNQVDIMKKQLEKKDTKEKRLSIPLDYNGIDLPYEGVIIDFETNSPFVKYARIFEVGAIKFKNGVIVDRFQSFSNPGIKIPKSIRELTGIKQSEIDAAPKSSIVMKNLLKFIGKTPILVGHNLHRYDFELLRTYMERFKLPPWKGQLLCTKKTAKKAQLIVNNYKLETLCHLFGIQNKSAHRALSDCEATFELLLALYEHTILGSELNNQKK